MADPRRRTRKGAIGLAAVAVMAAGITAWAASGSTGRADVVVGSKNFTEQVVLGELVAQALERGTTLTVDRRFNLGGTSIAHEALLSGGIDAYVEYTGTSLTAIFNQPAATDPEQVFATVRDRYASAGVTLLPRLGFNNTFAILVRGDAAQELGLKTVSDLARMPDWKAGFGYEFLERPDGFKGLSAAYGLRFAGAPKVMDLNLIYRAVAAGEIDVTAGDATSGLIPALGLAVLEDDRRYFPAYDAAPVVRAATLLAHPEVGAVLRGLSGRITAADMQRMNYAVDGERQDPALVVRAFLDRIDLKP